MNTPHPLASWVERTQTPRPARRTRRPRRHAEVSDVAEVADGAGRRSRDRSVIPLPRDPQD